jgi:hypothetical protein
VGTEAGWTGAENLAHTVIRSPDRPARSLSLPGTHIKELYYGRGISLSTNYVTIQCMYNQFSIYFDPTGSSSD